MPITLNGSGTISGVSVGGLPDGIVDTDMLASNAITQAKLPAGTVLQVVSTTKTDTFSTSSTSYTDITGMSVSITPTSASSKIFINVDVHGVGNTDTQIYIEILRTSDNNSVCIGDTAGTRVRSSLGSGYFLQTNDVRHQGINFLDSPNTTSTFNYKLRTRTQGSGTIFVNRAAGDDANTTSGRFPSTITVMEIAV